MAECSTDSDRPPLGELLSLDCRDELRRNDGRIPKSHHLLDLHIRLLGGTCLHRLHKIRSAQVHQLHLPNFEYVSEEKK